MTDFSPVITMSTRGIRPILDAAVHLGIDADGVLVEHGIDPIVVHRGEERIDRERIVAALAELSRLADGRPLGLAAARGLAAGDLGIVDFLVGSCGTLREAAELGRETFRLFHDCAELTLVCDGRHARYSLRPHIVRVVAPVLAEFVVAAFMQIVRRLSGHDLRASEVRFAHLRVPHVNELRAFFGCPVHFGADVNELVLPRIYLDLPLPKPDAALRRTLEECARQLIAKLPAPASFLDRARAHIAEVIGRGDVTLERIAAHLRLQPRTFQRALRRHGASYKSLLDDVRCELAVQTIATTDAPLADVAESLGFVDASAFSRAFRRWTGVSPSAYKMRAGCALDRR